MDRDIPGFALARLGVKTTRVFIPEVGVGCGAWMKSVLFVSALVSFVLLLGRLSGFVREMLLAASFGPTATADAAIVLLTLPDLMVGLLLAGGFNAVLIPAIKQAEGAARIALVWRVACVVGVAFAVLAVILAAMPDQVMAVMAPSLPEGELPDLPLAFRLSLIALPMVAVIGVAAAYLNSIGRFAVPNLSVLLFNLTLCAYLLAQQGLSPGLIGFALAILAASVVRFGLHLVFMKPFLRQAKPRPGADTSRVLDAGFVQRFALGVLGLGVTVAAPVVFRTLYAATGEGNLALYSFALKLFELPSAILIAPVVIVMIPKLASLTAPEERGAFDQALMTALMAGVALATVAACVAFVFAVPITGAVYGYGAMGAEGVARVAGLTVLLMLGLPFLVVVQLGAAALSAQGQVRQMVVWALVCLAVTAAAVALLQAVAQGCDLPFAAIGLTIYNALLAGCYLACLFGVRWPSGITLRKIGWIVLRSVAASLPFGAAMAYYSDMLGRWGGVGLAGTAGLLLLLANIGPLRALRRLQIDSR